MKNQSGYFYSILLPILAMALIAPFTPMLDLRFSSFFYQGNGRFDSGAFYDFMFDYAVLPAQITAILATIAFISSFFIAKLKKLRRPSFVLILTMLVGAGFIVHTVFKDHWGRPRPRQTIDFGGTQPYRPFYIPNFSNQESSKSFPCGHCTMGFFFFAPALVLLRAGYKKSFLVTMAFAVLLGIGLGIARMGVGAHYFSDVLMSGLIMWLVAYLFDVYIES